MKFSWGLKFSAKGRWKDRNDFEKWCFHAKIDCVKLDLKGVENNANIRSTVLGLCLLLWKYKDSAKPSKNSLNYNATFGNR